MRLIDADAMEKQAYDDVHYHAELEDWEFDLIVHYLEHAPTITIDAASVVHGRWIKTDNGVRENMNTGRAFVAYLHDCSVCGWHTGNQGENFNYCPQCGAKMDQEVENG